MVNRLKGTKSYLCGPIDRAPDRGKGWRDKISPDLENLGVEVIDPLDQKYNKNIEGSEEVSRLRKVWKFNEDYERLTKLMKKIRSRDLRLVDQCDFVIVNLRLTESPCGTWEELFWANRIKRPILLVCETGLNDIPDWIYGTIPYDMFFKSFHDMMVYLNRIDHGNVTEEELDARWYCDI